MGPSGSGRSTLMRCMAGLDRPTSRKTFVGHLEVGGLDDKQLMQLRRDRIGFVFQSFNLVPTLTAGENITSPIDLVGGALDKDWFDHLVRQLGSPTGSRTARMSCRAASSSAARAPAR
jgi:putative ABC transport system ATP-binding protein